MLYRRFNNVGIKDCITGILSSRFGVVYCSFRACEYGLVTQFVVLLLGLTVSQDDTGPEEKNLLHCRFLMSTSDARYGDGLTCVATTSQSMSSVSRWEDNNEILTKKQKEARSGRLRYSKISAPV